MAILPNRNTITWDTRQSFIDNSRFRAVAGISSLWTLPQSPIVSNSTFQTSAFTPAQPVLSRERRPLFNVRLDGPTPHFRFQRRNKEKAREYKHQVIANFSSLSTQYPFSLPHIGRPVATGMTLASLTFSFIGGKTSAMLYIKNIPAIEFYCEYNRGFEYVHLHAIQSDPTPSLKEHANLKRLFLRHMGFDCTKYKTGSLLKYKDGHEIFIDHSKQISFAQSEKYTLIGVTQEH